MQTPNRVESLDAMFRRLIFLPALAAALAATGALASVPANPSFREPPSARSAAEGAKLAQNADIEVYFDGDGNRVIVDAYTGEVIRIERPRRMTREAARRLARQRELGRAEPRYLDEFEDPAPVRRGGVYDPRFDENLGPVESFDPYLDSAPDYGTNEFPEPPRNPYLDAEEDQAPIVPEEVRREPLRAPAPEQQVRAGEEPDQAALGQDTGTEVIVADPITEPPITFSAREEVAAVQILMDRAGASPGVIDGKFGSNVDKAFAAYRTITGTNLKSTDSAGIKAALAATGGDPFITYTITSEDAAGPFVAAIPADYSEKALLPSMAYTSVTEALAERFHMDETYLKALNPEANFSRPGTMIRVANVGANIAGKVARITADKAQKQVLAYDAYDKLIAAYPATIGSADTPSPTGTHAVSRIALNPNYTYNPKLNFKQGENDKVLTIPPGPNGPVGSVWIALDKPTYGVHGTPDPSKIGKTESHGCVRLTNWDAEELAKLVSAGVTVEFLE